jgi:hypothetical protein
VNSSGCRDPGGGCSAHESERDSRGVAHFSPRFES